MGSKNIDEPQVASSGVIGGKRKGSGVPWLVWAMLGFALVILSFTCCWAYSIYGPLDETVLNQQEQTLLQVARADAATVEASAKTMGTASPSSLISQLPLGDNLRITLVDPAGVVIVDTQDDTSTMQNHLDRPEVAAALGGREGVSVHTSWTDSSERIYAAVPVELDNQTYALRVSVPLSDYRGILAQSRWTSLVIMGVAIGLAIAIAVISLLLAARPVRKLKRTQTAFVANASDALRVPATTVRRLSADVNDAAARKDLSGVQELAARLDDEGAVLEKLTLDLMSLEELQKRPTLDDVPDTSDLRDAVTSTVEQRKEQAANRGISLDFTDGTNSQIPCLVALSQPVAELVVDAIVGNAIENTRQGGVHLALSANRYAVTLQVADTGRGIPTQDIDKVFDKFYRVRRDDEDHSATAHGIRHGVGLGLAIAQQAISQAGGTIEAQSELGVGSTFTIRLPRLEEAAGE